MFFPDKIRNIKPGERVLEIGPGGTPHSRSNVFLEKIFDPSEIVGQRGYAPPLRDNREVVFYEGGNFPFRDNEFDYVICSHVLEHVDNVDLFVSELVRITQKGYLEFPTVYYDYIYNFPEHISLLLCKGDTIYWMPKTESGLNVYNSINSLFYESMKAGYTDIVDQLKGYFFQGFEWNNTIKTERVNDIKSITFDASVLNFKNRSKLELKSVALIKKIIKIFHL